MADYYPIKEGLISVEPIIGFAESGNTTVVNLYGVRSWTSDVPNKLMVYLAGKNSGWGIALETQATANKPVSVLLRGIVKLMAGASGTTRNYQQTFGSAGLLGDATAMTVHSGPVGWGLQSIAAGSEGLYLFNP